MIFKLYHMRPILSRAFSRFLVKRNKFSFCAFDVKHFRIFVKHSRYLFNDVLTIMSILINKNTFSYNFEYVMIRLSIFGFSFNIENRHFCAQKKNDKKFSETKE